MKKDKEAEISDTLSLDDIGEIRFKLNFFKRSRGSIKQFIISIPLNDEQIEQICLTLKIYPSILIVLQEKKGNFNVRKMEKFIDTFCRYSVSGYLLCSFLVDQGPKKSALDSLYKLIKYVDAINKRNAILTQVCFLFEKYQDYMSPSVEAKLFLERFMAFYLCELLSVERIFIDLDKYWLGLAEHRCQNQFDTYYAGDIVVHLSFQFQKLQLIVPGKPMDARSVKEYESLIKKRNDYIFKSRSFATWGFKKNTLAKNSLSDGLILDFKLSSISNISAPDTPVEFPVHEFELQLAQEVEHFQDEFWFKELDFSGAYCIDLESLRAAVKRKIRDVHSDKIRQRKDKNGAQETFVSSTKNTQRWTDILNSLPKPHSTKVQPNEISRLQHLRKRTQKDIILFETLLECQKSFVGNIRDQISKIQLNMESTAALSKKKLTIYQIEERLAEGEREQIRLKSELEELRRKNSNARGEDPAQNSDSSDYRHQDIVAPLTLARETKITPIPLPQISPINLVGNNSSQSKKGSPPRCSHL